MTKKEAASYETASKSLSQKNSYIPSAPPETVLDPTLPLVPDWSVSVYE